MFSHTVLMKSTDDFMIPALGIRVYEVHPLEVIESVEMAVRAGVRFIDSSAGHQNEKPTGFAINEILKRGFCKRKDFFISTNIYIEKYDEAEAQQKLQVSMENLGVEYLDLVTIHTSNSGNEANQRDDTFDINCSFLENGLCKAVGLTFWPLSEWGMAYVGRFPQFKEREKVYLHLFMPMSDQWKVCLPHPDLEETHRVFETANTRLTELENNPPQNLREDDPPFVLDDREFRITYHVLRLADAHGEHYAKSDEKENDSSVFKVYPLQMSLDEFAQFEYFYIERQNYLWRLNEAFLSAFQNSIEKRKPCKKVQIKFSTNLTAAVIKGAVFGLSCSLLYVFLRS